MSDNFVETYFNSKKSSPSAIKKIYEEAVKKYCQPGVNIIANTQDRFSAVYTNKQSGISYLVDEFDEFVFGDVHAGKVGCSYKDSEGTFVNVGARYFYDGVTATTYKGFTINEGGEVAYLSAEQSKITLDEAQTAVDTIKAMQNTVETASSTQATTPTTPSTPTTPTVDE